MSAEQSWTPQQQFAWPVDRLAEAVERSPRASGLRGEAASAPRHRSGAQRVACARRRRRRRALSRSLDFEVESADVTYGDVERMLRPPGPRS